MHVAFFYLEKISRKKKKERTQPPYLQSLVYKVWKMPEKNFCDGIWITFNDINSANCGPLWLPLSVADCERMVVPRSAWRRANTHTHVQKLRQGVGGGSRSGGGGDGGGRGCIRYFPFVFASLSVEVRRSTGKSMDESTGQQERRRIIL